DRDVPAVLRAGPREGDVTGEAVEDGPLGGAVGEEDGDDVLVGVAVVDLQREPELLGQGDVVAERRALDLPGPFPAAEEVEAGLPDRPDPLVARELRDPGDSVVQGRLVTRGDGGVEPVRRDLPDARVER